MSLHREKYWHHITVKLFVIIVGFALSSHIQAYGSVMFFLTTTLKHVFARFWVLFESLNVMKKI